MINVQSKAVLNKYMWQDLRSKKVRTVIVVVAILLTTVLFNTFFVSTYNLNRAMQEIAFKSVGSRYHGGLKNLTKQEYSKLIGHPQIEKMSYSIVFTHAQNEALHSRTTEIRSSSSEEYAKDTFAHPTTGRMPLAQDEIALDTTVLAALNIEPKLGAEIPIEYRLNDTDYHATFKLVGYWQANSLMPISQLWVSESYIAKALNNYVPVDAYDATGKYFAFFYLKNSHNIEYIVKEIANQTDLTSDYSKISVNPAYAGLSKQQSLEPLIYMIVLLLAILLAGYLIISNVYYISITSDMKQYGLLRTLGMTIKQIRAMLYKQLLLTLLFAIPIGCLIGTVVAKRVAYGVVATFKLELQEISFDGKIYFLTILFVCLTALISVMRPVNRIKKLSAIQALSTIDALNTKRKKSKSIKISPIRLAFKNVLRHKKRLFVVMLSLTLSLFMFNMTLIMLFSFNEQKMIKNWLLTDFSIADAGYYNSAVYPKGASHISDTIYRQIQNAPNITDYANIYYKEVRFEYDTKLKQLVATLKKNPLISDRDTLNYQSQLEDYRASVYGLDDFAFSHLEIVEGSIDIALLKEGNHIIVNTCFLRDKENGGNPIKFYNIGDKVTLKDKSGFSKTFIVMAIADIPYPISERSYSVGIVPRYFIPSQCFLNEIGLQNPMLSIFNVAENYQSQMENWLELISRKDSSFQFAGKSKILSDINSTLQGIMMTGITLSLVIGLIGVVNYINTMITSVLARSKELALLKAVGMTDRQQKTMLITESLIYGVCSLILMLLIGNGLVYAIFSSIAKGSPIYDVKYIHTLKLMPFATLAIIGITLFIGMAIERYFNKKTAISRLTNSYY